MRRVALVVCLLSGLPILSSAQQPSLRTATTTILFEVVARDRKGAPVRDLAVADLGLIRFGGRMTRSQSEIVARAQPARHTRGCVGPEPHQVMVSAHPKHPGRPGATRAHASASPVSQCPP